MPKRTDVVAEQLGALADDLENLWRAVTRDPAKEARRARLWTILSAALAAAATIGARRLVAKIWPILTGEQPPTPRGAQTQGTRPAARQRERQRTSEDPTTSTAA